MSVRLIFRRATVPNTTLKVLERLGKTLLREVPENQAYEPIIAPAAKRLGVWVDKVERALIERFRETNSVLAASELEFDRACDTGWVWLRRLLEGWHGLLTHPGLDALPPELATDVELDELRKIGELAGKLHEQLFGAEGTNWVNENFISQSETMATILGLIDSDDLADPIAKVVGSRLLLLLDGCQQHYEAMVADRLNRQTRTDNFAELRSQLRWELDRYKSTIENLYEPDDPATHAFVEKALRPLVLLNQLMVRASSADELDELLDDDFVELDLPEDDTTEPPANGPPAV